MFASALAFLAAVWLVARWRPFRIEVRGDSMAPTLLPGDWALAAEPGTPTRGHVVVVEHPTRPGLEMVKRITGVPGDLTPDGRILGPEEYWVEGDNPTRSTDSRHHGPVRLEQVKARVRVVYWPPSRRGVVPPRRALRA
jgi:signal peptidase I